MSEPESQVEALEAVETTETVEAEGTAQADAPSDNFAAAVAALEGKPAEKPEQDTEKADDSGEEDAEDKEAPGEGTTAEAAAQGSKDEALFEKKFAELQREWQRLDKERQGLKAVQREYNDLKNSVELAKKFPAKAFELLGVEPDKFTEEYVKNGGTLSEAEKIALETRNEVAKLQEQLQQQQAHVKETEKARLTSQFRQETVQFLQGQKDNFELTLSDPGGVDRVMEVINMHYQRTYNPETQEGQILTYEQAAQAVEKAYEDEVGKLLKLGKVAKKIGSTEKAQDTPRASKTAKTLTSSMSPSTKAERPLTADERFKHALKLLVK